MATSSTRGRARQLRAGSRFGARTGLVVAGAGARGAYEAGALSELVPRMLADGAPPRVLVGTSAGALNVVGLGGFSVDGWDAATRRLVELWSAVQLDDIVGLLSSLLGGAGHYTAQLLGVPGPASRVASLLDTSRLRGLLAELLPLEQLHAAIDSGELDAVAVATTSTSTGGSVVFVERGPGVALPEPDTKRNITYVDTRLTVDHVLASIAVPAVFRPVRVSAPDGSADWYVDGGLRLNTPLKPAIDLGCGQLGVVATHPCSWPGGARELRAGAPDVFHCATLMLQALLVDRMVEDLLTLSQVNRLLEGTATSSSSYRQIPFIFAGPPPAEAGAIGALANEVFVREYSGLRGARTPTAWLFDRAIGGSPESHGELLSFFLFERPFTSASAELGARHAAAVSAAPSAAAAVLAADATVPGPEWRTAV